MNDYGDILVRIKPSKNHLKEIKKKNMEFGMFAQNQSGDYEENEYHT